MEHLHHFQLAKDPFRNEPMLELFLETRCHGDALRRLERGVRQSRGLCLLTGDAGSGKTMLLRQLHENLEEEIFDASMLVVLPGRVDASWLLQRFARQLGVEDVAPERDAVVAQVYEQLAIIREDGRHAVLIIDDAQALASPETRRDNDIAWKLHCRLDQTRNVLRVMLSVGIQGDYGIHGLCKRSCETPRQAGGLAQVGVVFYQRHGETAQPRASLVLGTVVDDKHCLCVTERSPGNLRHRIGLVERRYDDRDTHGAGSQIIAPLMPIIWPET